MRSRLLLTSVLASACLAAPPGAAQEGPVRVLFDSDMGSDCDDAGALALLHSYADEGRAEIIGCLYSSGRVPYGAAVIEAINVYYGRPDIPVGAAHYEDLGDPVDKMTAEKLARDRAAFGHRIVHNRDAPEQTRLSRRLLAAQPDGSVTYLTVGHTRGLHDLLVSEADDVSPLDGRALIERKVRRWVAMGAQGAANDERQWRKDWNLCRNGRCDGEVGNTVDASEASYTNDIGDAELRATWTDPDFDPNHRAVCYVRVLEIPTPTWQAYDAAYHGLSLPPEVPAVHQERAYTSPIWYIPGN